jgi:hypothetical protein
LSSWSSLPASFIASSSNENNMDSICCWQAFVTTARLYGVVNGSSIDILWHSPIFYTTWHHQRCFFIAWTTRHWYLTFQSISLCWLLFKAILPKQYFTWKT